MRALWLRDLATAALVAIWPKWLVLPGTRASYAALVAALKAQKVAIPVDILLSDSDPYGTSSAFMRREVARTGTLKVWTGASDGHPVLSPRENWLFRAVHDWKGHIETGAGFNRAGERRAYLAHKASLPKAAHRALWAETEAPQAFYRVTGGYAPGKAVGL